MPERPPDLDEELRALAPALDAWNVDDPPDALIERTMNQARQLLHAPTAVPSHEAIPKGFKRELAKLLATIVPPLALVLAWNAFVLFRGPELLGEWLPAWLPSSLAWALPMAYVLGAAGWLALVVGSLPLFAHRRAWNRTQEALS